MNPPKTVFFGIIAAVLVTGILIGGSSQQTTAAKDIIIPGWVKNNAAWWSSGEIADADYASGIEYMIEAGIIKVPAAQVASAQGMTNGQPFDEIWAAIGQLQTDLANVQTSDGIPGPQGPAGPQGEQGEQGPQGPPGDSGTSTDVSDLEARILALENKPIPILQIRTVATETPIAAGLVGSSTPAYCNEDELLIHGTWLGSSTIKPAYSWRALYAHENSGVQTDFQDGSFLNDGPVNVNVRVQAHCAKIVQP